MSLEPREAGALIRDGLEEISPTQLLRGHSTAHFRDVSTFPKGQIQAGAILWIGEQ